MYNKLSCVDLAMCDGVIEPCWTLDDVPRSSVSQEALDAVPKQPRPRLLTSPLTLVMFTMFNKNNFSQLHSQIFSLRRSIPLALSKEAALARKEARKWVRRCRVHLWK